MTDRDGDSNRKTARRAGLLYLLASIPGAFALLYVPGKLVVPGDAAATADRIRTSEGLLRMGVGAELVCFTLFIFVALTFYRLFRPVSERHALAMMILLLISVPIWSRGVSLDLLISGSRGVGAEGSVLIC